MQNIKNEKEIYNKGGNILNINYACKDDFLIFRLYGELDMKTVPNFKEKIKKLRKEKKANKVIINLSKIKFIDSTGVGAILGRYRTITENKGQLILVGVNKRVNKIFDLSGITGLIPIYENEKKAIIEYTDKGGK